MSTATKIAKIRHEPNDTHTAYIVDEVIDTNVFGTVRLQATCDRLPEESYRDHPGEYRVSMYIDDTLVINQKPYEGVQVTASSHDDGDGPFDRVFAQIGWSWGGMTASAHDAVVAAATPIIEAFVERQGGPAALKRKERNDSRIRKAGYERDKARRHIELAEQIEARIET